MNYSYYDTPEGQDCFPKLLYTTKYAAIAGIGVSTLDVLMYSRPQGYFQTVARFAHFTAPFVGIAAAFTATTCLANTIRHKDDKLNYFMGGCASGAVFGAWRRSGYAGFIACLAFGGAAMLKKLSLEEGWSFLPENKLKAHNTLRGVHSDYSLIKNPAPNWSTSEN